MKYIIIFLFVFVGLLQSKALEEVSLQLKWKYQFQFAGFIAAKEKGFYKDVGLAVELKEFDNSLEIINDVIDGKTQFGISDSSLVYEGLTKKPLTAMMAIFQDSPFILMGLKNSKIKKLEDIHGEKLALYEGVDGISIKTMLESKNIDYNAVAPIFKLDDLLNKKADMMTAYISNEPFVAKQRGIEVVTFSPKDYGFEGYGDILFTSNKLLKNNPQLVQKMHQASYKGWIYAFKNIDEMVNLMYDKYNTLNKTKETLKYEAIKLKELSGYGNNFGELNVDKVKGIAQQFNLMSKENNKLSNLDNFIYKYNYRKSKIKYKLTKEEKQYLKNKKEITICIKKGFMPFEDFQNGKHIGLTSSYFEIFKKNLDIQINIKVVRNSKEAISFLNQKKCDIVSTNEENEKYKNSINTYPYIISPLMVAIGSRVSFISDFNNLQNKKIGIDKKFSYLKDVNKFYPNITLVDVKNVEDGLYKVDDKELFGQIGSLAQLAHLFEKNFMGELKIAGKSDDVNLRLSMLIDENDITLYNVMQKSIKNLDEHIHYNLLNKWAAIKYDKPLPNFILYPLIAGLIIAILVVILVMYKNKKINIAQNKINKLNNSLEQRVIEEVEKNKKQQLLMLHQSRLAQMGEMISMIAHQWRQPLNSLSMLNQSIILKYNRDKLTEEFIEYFKVNSNKQIQNMSKTIDDFRDFFKPEKEKVEFFINDIVSDTLEMVKPIFSQNQINIIFDVEEKIQIIGYPNELGQAILNIINNAKDALVENDKKNKQIKIELIQNNNSVTLIISDNACGIPEYIIEKIFDPYFSTKEEKNGTGLGLYMSKLIIEEHMSGKLNVLNNTDGAVFMIQMPIYKKVN